MTSGWHQRRHSRTSKKGNDFPAGRGFTNPRQLGILWELQYKPRFEFLEKNLNKETLARWKTKSLNEKIAIVDRLQAKGMFGKE